MSDKAAGPVADAGQAVQSGLNQAADAHDKLAQIIRDHPLAAVLVAVGLGYVLGKIV